MSIQIILNGKVIYSGLTEAEMDESYQLLSNSPNGLCAVGLASCYALLIKNENKSALWHIALTPSVTQEKKPSGKHSTILFEEIRSVLTDLMVTWPNQTIEVILANSTKHHQLSVEEDGRNCPEERDENFNAIEYFLKYNEQYKQFMACIFSEIDKVPGLNSEQITLSCIDIPHDFLVVDSSNQIQLYKEHHDDEIRWDELPDSHSADLDSGIKSEEEKENAQVLASKHHPVSIPELPADFNHNINEARDNERALKKGNKRTAGDSFFQSNKKQKEAVLQQQQARVSQNVIDEEKGGGFKKHQ